MLLAVLMACAALTDDSGLFVPRMRLISEVESVRWQMGRVDDDTPHWQVIAYPELGIGDDFSIGMMFYTDTRMSDRRDATLRRMFYENDVFPYVSWDYEIFRGWTLQTKPQLGFSYIDEWKGEAEGTPNFFGDFRWTETLYNPYVSVFVFFRRMYDPGNRMNGHIGLFREFRLPWWNLVLTPDILFFFGNAEENALRFGLDPTWNGENRHHSGFSSVMPGLKLSKTITEQIALFVSFKELVVVNDEFRSTLEKRDRPINYLDIPIFSIGLSISL